MVSWGPKPGNKQDGRPRTPGNWGVPRAGLDLRVQGSVCATDPYALAKQARAQTAPPQYAAEEEDWNDIVPPQKTARDRARPAWTPGGQHFSAMAALPETNHPRPLHEPTYMPATQGGTQRAPRTVGQLEHCLREWTWKHRELHESRRTTLGRALMLASGFDKRLLRSANSPEANRASDTTASGGWRSARGSTLHRRASFNTETNPTLPSMASVQAASPAWEGKDIRELSSAERWALKRHQAIAKAHEQRGSIPALTAGILDPFSPTPMSTAFTESTGVWGAPPPKRMSQHAELAASRAASQGQENLSQAAQDKAALKDLALTRAQLLAAWSRLLAAERKQPGQAPPCLELELTEAEADALIFVHGRRKAEWASPWSGVGDGTVAVGDVLLVAKLVEAVLTDPSHTLNQQKVVHGAPRAGAQLEGRILVPPCRTPLYAPSAFDFQAAAARSAQQPSARLELEAVHGYAGFDNTCPNLFYAHDGSIVYYTAGVGLAAARQATASGGQRYANLEETFPGTDCGGAIETAIKEAHERPEGALIDAGPSPASSGTPNPRPTAAAALLPAESGPARTITAGPAKPGDQPASSQAPAAVPPGAKPCVAIWTLDGCKEQRCLYHEEGSRGITALAFCGGKGRWLTTVATDNQHTVRVWDWSVGRVVAQGPGYQGAPPQVYGAVWDQDLDQGEARFLTFGVKHLKQWDRTTDPRNSYAGRICAWSGAEPQTVLCAAFLPAGMDGRLAYFARMRRGVTVPRRAQFEGVIATGHPNGAVYFWRERAVIATLQSYQLPAKVNLLQESKPEGSQGVRCLRFWDLGPEDSLAAKMQGGGAASARRGVMRIAPLTVPGAGEGVSAAIRSLDVRPDGTAVLVGTHGCDVWELALDLDQDQTPQVDPDLDGAEDSELGIFADGQGPAASRAAAVTIPTTTAAVAIPTAAVATPTPTAAVAIPTTTMAGTIPTTTEAVTIPTTTAATTTLADVAAEVPNAGAGAGPLPVSSSASHGQGASAAASILQQNLPPIPPHGAQTGTTGSKPAPAHPPGSANPHIGTASHAAASSSSTQAEQAAAERRASGNQAGPNPLAAVTAAAAAAKLPKRLVCGHSGNLYAVAVHPSNPDVYVTACDDNEVLVWHARQRHPLGLPIYASAAARAVAFAEPHGHHIAVGLEDGALEVYDRKRRRIMHTRRCQHEISEVKYAPCGNVLATASHDCVIDLYNVGKGYQCYARCRGHSATVAHLDFSTDSRILQSTCHANEIMYWDVLTGRQLAQCQRDRKWRTWTCPFGFPVLGIWGDTAAVSGTDINAVCRDPQERLLVSADDFGHLSLFNWPCIVATAGSRIYGGHSAHVMGVRFNADGSRVISVGGHDRSVFQWRVVQTDDCLDTEINSLRNDGPALAPVLQRTSVAEQLMNRQKTPSAAGYVKARLAQMQSHLNCELEKLRLTDGGSKGTAQPVVAPPGKVWGPANAKGTIFGWVDPPAQG
ncbi:hypothetical protein WJX72_002429 [[Myrmecia] bisecta]|uniref:EML-like second beta-propeller domain-containing protein n=1 Tax=[Myrmecia] bisecta TaxID=41462 RepID=A0AAW1R5B3_9CHLO